MATALSTFMAKAGGKETRIEETRAAEIKTALDAWKPDPKNITLADLHNVAYLAGAATKAAGGALIEDTGKLLTNIWREAPLAAHAIAAKIGVALPVPAGRGSSGPRASAPA